MDADLPEPSAELVLIRVLLEAHLDNLSPKEAARFIRRINSEFELRRGLMSVSPIRAPHQFTLLRAAQRQADAWMSKALAARAEKVS